MMYSALPIACPQGVSLLAYRQTSPGNVTQFSTAVIRGINTMMSL